jgi:hypothetical protein
VIASFVQAHTLYVVIAAAAALLVVIVIAEVIRRRPKSLNDRYFRERWQGLQKLLADKNTWPLAIINADKLLDEALKRRRFKGKTMGERLVAAQRSLSSNDTVWFAHKMRNKIVHEDFKVVRKNDVKDALLGYLQALKDLGAIK